MTASIHNFILNYNELNIITELLRASYENNSDENSANSTKVLHDKLITQRDSGYPAKDYPFWRNYFDDSAKSQCRMCNGNINECHCNE